MARLKAATAMPHYVNVGGTLTHTVEWHECAEVFTWAAIRRTVNALRRSQGTLPAITIGEDGYPVYAFAELPKDLIAQTYSGTAMSAKDAESRATRLALNATARKHRRTFSRLFTELSAEIAAL